MHSKTSMPHCLLYGLIFMTCGLSSPAFAENILTPGTVPLFDPSEDYGVLEPLSATDQKNADDWVALLDSEEYETRMDAYDHLRALGGRSFQHLSAIYENWAKRPEVTSLEARTRLRQVVDQAENVVRWHIYRRVQNGFARAMERPEGQCFFPCDPALDKRLQADFKPHLSNMPLGELLFELSKQAGVTIVLDPDCSYESDVGTYFIYDFHGSLLQFLENANQLQGLRVVKFGKAIVLTGEARFARWSNLIATYPLPSRDSEKWTEEETQKVCQVFLKYGDEQRLNWLVKVCEPGKLTLIAPAEQQKAFSALMNSLLQPRCEPDVSLAFSGFKPRSLYRTISFETQKTDLPNEFRQLKTLTGLDLRLDPDLPECRNALLDIWKVNEESLEQVLLQFCQRWHLRIHPVEKGWLITQRYVMPSRTVIAIDFSSALNGVTLSEDTRKDLMGRVGYEASGETDFCDQVYHGYWFGISDPWSEVRIKTYLKLAVHAIREARDLESVIPPPRPWFFAMQ